MSATEVSRIAQQYEGCSGYVGRPRLRFRFFLGAQGPSVRAAHCIFAGDPGNKERKHAEEATCSAVCVGTYVPAGDDGARARGRQVESGALGRSCSKKQQGAFYSDCSKVGRKGREDL